jgi:hypothetical protein
MAVRRTPYLIDVFPGTEPIGVEEAVDGAALEPRIRRGGRHHPSI